MSHQGGTELKPISRNVKLNCIPIPELPIQNPLGQGVLDVLLDEAFEGAGAVGGVVVFAAWGAPAGRSATYNARFHCKGVDDGCASAYAPA